MVDSLSKHYLVRVIDMDKDTMSQVKYAVRIEDGETKTKEILEWCDVILAKCSTFANEAITYFMNNKPIMFYGTTIAATAALLNLEIFCPESHWFKLHNTITYSILVIFG
jgi:hypothetical protein